MKAQNPWHNQLVQAFFDACNWQGKPLATPPLLPDSLLQQELQLQSDSKSPPLPHHCSSQTNSFSKRTMFRNSSRQFPGKVDGLNLKDMLVRIQSGSLQKMVPPSIPLL